MSFQEDLPALASENLFDFLLKDEIPCPTGPGNSKLIEDCSLSEPEVLDKDMDGLITSVLLPLEDELDILDDYLLEKSDSSISENVHPFHSPGSNSAGGPQSSDIIQTDHNYSLYLQMPVLESMRSNVAEGSASIQTETSVGLEGTSVPLEESSAFPVAVPMDDGPQLGPGDTVQTGERLLKELQQQQPTQDSHQIDSHSLEDRPLLVELGNLQTLVTHSTTVTTTAKNNTLITVVSLNFTFCSSLDSLQSGETELAHIVELQQTCPNQVAPDVQDVVLEDSSPEPEDVLLLVSFSPTLEEEPIPPDPNASNSSYYIPVADSDLGPSQPQEQKFPEESFAVGGSSGVEYQEAGESGTC